ncbi:glutamine synthetase [Rhodobacter sp. HX-7-19]|uniref:Glutamine synthetase n=1 Tax=Paragemmobacter kunshanensis TaxID=2583234 RepID=A0A6M1TKL1_9RHOB|nr:glutamine synthetase family protein [Rhodobacter kunshanensis]NGQ90469.1 glutamine synthetase [Rhodobacter kunshanensis]
MADRLRAMFCDHLSLMRGKYLPASKMKSDGTRLARPTFSVHWDKDLILDAPHTKCREGIPDMEFRWDGTEIRDGWEPGTRVVTGDLYDSDGAPLPLCPRGALKRAVADWGRHGLTPKVGIELEAFAFEIGEDGGLSPLHAPGGIVYGTGPFADPAGFTDAIWHRAEEAGFRLELITAEYDTPQYEFTLAYDEAVKAVDEMVLFRQMAREVALEHGILLTFLPKPILEKGGSGLHFNLSFADAAGKNALATGPKGGPDHMNDLARGCVAGWMRHHKGLAGILAPTVGSYLRLQPASMSGYWCNWGGDHRGVTVRVSEEGGAKTRLEHRMADASCNPYTALAALLQAARLGMENAYPLPEAEAGDCFDRIDAGFGVAASLAEAMDDLEADTALCAALGPEIAEHHIFMKRIEVDKTAGLEGAALRDYYIWYV